MTITYKSANIPANLTNEIIAKMVIAELKKFGKATHYGQLVHYGFVIFPDKNRALIKLCKRHQVAIAKQEIEAQGWACVTFELD